MIEGIIERNEEPDSGNNLFTGMIDISDVFNFRSSQDIYGYSVCNDGDIPIFEMANKKFYKKNIYPSLHRNRNYSDEEREVGNSYY